MFIEDTFIKRFINRIIISFNTELVISVVGKAKGKRENDENIQ